MSGNCLSHSWSSLIRAQNVCPVIKVAAPEDKLPHCMKNEHRIDELLRAFSDVAYSGEEQDLPWESWNYNRISAF